MSDTLQILVDGKPDNSGWPLDRALQFGDGLFETMQVRSGRIRFAALHAARLARGCERLAIRADLDNIWQQTAQLAHELGTALIKLQVTRGDATARGYTPSGHEHPRTIVQVHPAPRADEIPADIRVVTLSDCLGENPALAGLKHCNRLEQVLARMSLAGSGAFEGLLASSSGWLISGTMSNVFLEVDGMLLTPALGRCGIEGVLRAVVLREAERAGMQVKVTDLPMNLLARCTSLSLSNARMGLQPVRDLDGRRLAHSTRLVDLAARIEALEE